jgi:phosphotransferase system HPr-like phosphotransfer protein
MLGRPGDKLVKANSPLMLMAMKVKTGETLVIAVESDDEAAAAALVAEIQELLRG